MIKKLLCWFVLAFVVVSCDESYVTPDPNARGLNFYPLAVGDYRVYEVTNIRYQHNIATETRFQMREWVADSFLDQTNTLTYKIIRSIRPDAQSEWEDDSVMVVTRSNSNVILTKDNTKYVKLVFPVQESKVWEADAFNNRMGSNLKKEQYMYTSVDQPYQLDATTYDSTVVIIVLPSEIAEPTVVDDRKEVYARGIGMVYRLFKKLNMADCNTTPDLCRDTQDYILDGHERHEVLIGHGKL